MIFDRRYVTEIYYPSGGRAILFVSTSYEFYVWGLESGGKITIYDYPPKRMMEDELKNPEILMAEYIVEYIIAKMFDSLVPPNYFFMTEKTFKLYYNKDLSSLCFDILTEHGATLLE